MAINKISIKVNKNTRPWLMPMDRFDTFLMGGLSVSAWVQLTTDVGFNPVLFILTVALLIWDAVRLYVNREVEV